ncbi:hypothetical protein [Planococcus lenghuensis]|uniref:Shikimate kinase n=1 Tax=Planococcus lenghuensis TaxID=2213202 RepID=A0A1Q2L3A9_9BACL|nr:hypothetical protein [Planococcus lenghuensis]AQQ54854.1 hypothetical protein B0X71_18270 [Planococcus lenghuensis]
MADLTQQLSHVYWIGGSPCAGKTSVARLLEEECSFTYYKADDKYDEHALQSNTELHPNMSRIKHLTWGQYWSKQFCTMPISRQVQESIDIFEEQFSMVVEDLLKLPDSSPILVEGSVVLPHKVAPLLADSSQAVWLFPTPEFQFHYYSKREWIHHILRQTENPEQAFTGWMNKEIGFAQQIRQHTDSYGFTSINVDGSQSIRQNADSIKALFNLI